MLVLSELAVFLDSLCSSAKSIKDLFDTSTLLHRDDSELILLIYPDKERLGIVVENTTTRRPITVKIASEKEPVSFFEKEVVINELLLNCRVHAFERVEFTLEISVEIFSSFNNGFHDLESLCLANTWTKRIICEVSTNTDTCGVYHSSLIFGKFSSFKTL
jgi:hypothetical protein